MRKVIQMTVTHIPQDGRYYDVLYTALCNDGTMWQGDGCWSNQWEQLPPIPQDSPKID